MVDTGAPGLSSAPRGTMRRAGAAVVLVAIVAVARRPAHAQDAGVEPTVEPDAAPAEAPLAPPAVEPTPAPAPLPAPAPAVEPAAPAVDEPLSGVEEAGDEGEGELGGVEVGEANLADLSLEELLNVEIVTASNMAEALSRAPGVVIRLSREELLARGYTEVWDLLDDLPGMDVVRPWGDNYVKSYWRGYRTDVSFPFLVMIDGVVTNSLWTNEGSHAVAVPMSMIDHVEVVYGPVSAVYGANAFMGVINIVTIGDEALEGTHARARLSSGTYGFDRLDQTILDVHVLHKMRDLRLSVAARLASAWTDRDAAERFEWSRAGYAEDPALWGGYTGYESLARGASSPIEEQGVDVRLYAHGLELAVRRLALSTGYGLVYPTDRAQPYARWVQEEREVYGRYTAALGEDVEARTLLRARSSGIPNTSYFLEGYGAPRMLDVSYWQSQNFAYSLFHDIEAGVGHGVTLVGGIKYERRDLQRGYDVNYGMALAPEAVPAPQDGSVPFPAPPAEVLHGESRAIQDDYGVYLQGRLQRKGVLLRGDGHALHLGVRYDYNSQFGAHDSPTIRAAYVGELATAHGTFLAKLLYGEGFHEPNARQLYGGWAGSSSSIALEPEVSRTLEVNVSHATARLSNLISVYYAHNVNTILLLPAPAPGQSNAGSIGRRNVVGVDYHVQALLSAPHVDFVKLWGYYSYLRTDEHLVAAGIPVSGNPDDPNGREVCQLDPGSGRTECDGPVGDLARNKAWLGATARFVGRYTATARGRFVGIRKTVPTNPVSSVPRYALLDLSGRIERVFHPSVSLTLRIDNVLGTDYAHPGIRTADSGRRPGAWAGAVWQGSNGWYNSELPQPGRRVLVTLGLDY